MLFKPILPRSMIGLYLSEFLRHINIFSYRIPHELIGFSAEVFLSVSSFAQSSLIFVCLFILCVHKYKHTHVVDYARLNLEVYLNLFLIV